jgi:hypothetical protein
MGFGDTIKHENEASNKKKKAKTMEKKSWKLSILQSNISLFFGKT